MKKWWLFISAGVLVVGCAGGNGGSSGTTGTTGATTSGALTSGGPGNLQRTVSVNLANRFSEFRVMFLSGQGRRSPGSQYAALNNFHLQTTPLDSIPVAYQGALEGINTQLDGYSVNKYHFTYDLGAAASQKTYTGLSYEVWQMSVEDPTNHINVVYPGPPVALPVLSTQATLFPGRQTVLQLFLNDAHLSYDAVAAGVVFNQAAFEADNFDTGKNYVSSFLADHVSFDISGVPARPKMASGVFADHFYLSGDAEGLSAGLNGPKSFDIYSPNFVESGVITQPATLGGLPVDTVAGVGPGTYTVLEPDPRAVPGSSVKIAALQGYWRNYTDLFNDVGAFAFIVFPTSRPGQQDEAVAFSVAGGKITNLWIGTANTTTGTFSLRSIDQIGVANPTNPVTGTFSALTSKNGSVSGGNYAVGSSAAGFPFAATGSFITFRY